MRAPEAFHDRSMLVGALHSTGERGPLRLTTRTLTIRGTVVVAVPTVVGAVDEVGPAAVVVFAAGVLVAPAVVVGAVGFDE